MADHTSKGKSVLRSVDVGDPQAVLASIVESSADGIIGQRLDGTVTIWNAGAEHMYGWQASEMLGQSIRRLIPESLLPEVEFIAERVRKGERIQELLTRRIRKDGRVIDVSLTVAAIRSKEGHIVGMATIERDVTRRRRLDALADGQRRLLETLSRTNRLVDGLHDLLDSFVGLTGGNITAAVMKVEPESHRLTPVASRLPRSVGRILQSGIELVPNMHPSGEAAFRRQAVSIPDVRESSGWNTLRDAVVRAGFLSCCATPIFSPDGEVLGTLDLYGREAVDPSPADLEVAAALAQTAALAIERSETVEELKLRRQVLQAVNQINALLAADLDVERIVRRVNEEATELVGAQMGAFFYSEVESEGLGFRLYSLAGSNRDMFSQFDMPRNTPLFSQTLTVGALQRFSDVTSEPRYGKNEPHAGIPEGHPVVRSFMSAPVMARSGEVLGMLLFGHAEPGMFTRWHEEILRGIASQTALAIDNARLYSQAAERANALADANQRKNEFLAMLGHELRNPLGAMAASLAIIQDSLPKGSDGREAADILYRQSQHMRRLVDDLLDLSRITRGKIPLRRETVDARRIVRHAVESARSVAYENGQEISYPIPASPIWVHADPVRVEQIVGNLLHNAMKFSPQSATIEVRAESTGAEARIVVRDHGLGIPVEKLEAIFEIFAQEHESDIPPSGGGLGLGLTLVRELARLHGGWVSARSDGAGKGSEFEVRLPTSEAPVESAPPIPSTGTPLEVRLLMPVLRVLLAEDQPDAARAMTLLLERWGHRVILVTNGLDALEAIKNRKPDAALIDIGLPGLDGWEVARSIRQSAGLETLPLAALTGLGQHVDERRSREAGFERHFVKPAEPEVLKRWLEEICRAIR